MRRRRFMNKAGGVEELPYLTIKALEDGLTAKLSNNACQYSTDGVTWTDLAAGTTTPAINKGKKLYFKATGLTPSSSAGIGTFTVSKQFNLSGNCMSMLFGDEAESNLDLTGKNYAFYRLFYNCTTLKSVSSEFLPATTLASYCYDSMFYDTNVLPDCTNIDFSSSSVVNSGGLKGLFAGTRVTDSDLRSILPINPDSGNYWLPSTTLANYCYQYMFKGCTELTTAPELPATTLAYGCYHDMFYGCSSLTTAPELPAMTMADYCYDGMFQNCTGLITAPELPATTLAEDCYYCMFYGCSNLTTAPELPAMTLTNSCYSYMFYNCAGLTTAPELPAMTLASRCYGSMFQNCSKLNYIKVLFTTTPGSSYTNNWVSGVASTGTFVKNAAATWDVTGVNGIPSGWTVETASA